MYAKTFLIEDEDAKKAFVELTSDPLIITREVHEVYAEGYGVKATVYYDTLKDLTCTEQIRLMSNALIAEECMENPEFTQLKNQRSRELWLLAEKGVPSSVAKDIIILTGDEMKGIRRKVKKG